MLAALASAALIAGGSLAVGQAALALCGRREPDWLGGPVGLAILLTAAAIGVSLGARGAALAATYVSLLLLAAGALLAGNRPGGGGGGEAVRRSLRSTDARTPADEDVKPAPEGGQRFPATRAGDARVVAPLTAALLAAVFAALPFIVAGKVGILGVGLVNDDMASHLLIADWIAERFRPEPVFIDQGYPLGPHALVAGLASLLGASSIDVFAGLVLAIPMLTALVAFGALTGLRSTPRALASVVVAVPYMVAAYLAQEAFKEPILALFLLGFALLLPSVRSPRGAIPLGLIAAGAVYTYSFPALAWLLGTAAVWAVIESWRHKAGTTAPGGNGLRRGLRSTDARTPAEKDVIQAPERISPIPGVLAAATAFLILVAPELPRILDFTDFRALDPDRANEGGLGNLREQLSPLVAFGIWPTSEFRLPAGAGALPAAAFYLGGLAGALAFALALPRWLRRHGAAIPAAIAAAVLLYLGARALGTVYTSAKALSILAPLLTLVTLGGLLSPERADLTGPGSERGGGGRPPAPTGLLDRFRRPLAVLGAVVALAVAFSSFLVLRQAPVAPEDHMNELAEIRPLVEGEKLLFLGRDNFVLYELRGSKPFTAVKNYYDPYYVEPNTELADVFSKFDFDSVTARTLARFPYVLTTRAAYASGPPPGYRVVEQTASYALWARSGEVAGREPAEADAAPGRVVRCPDAAPTGIAAAFSAEPELAPASAWSPATLESGDTATASLDLPPGSWRISLRYDSTRPVTLSARAGDSEAVSLTELPGNLDYRGPAPFWPAGSITTDGGEVEITARVEDPPALGRLLGASAVAHLGELAASPSGEPYAGGESPLPGEGASVLPARAACGGYTDWFDRRASVRGGP